MFDTLDRLRTAVGASYRVQRELGAGGMATVYPVAVIAAVLAAMMFARRGDGGRRIDTTGRASVAVLPFVDLSPEKKSEYFGDGIAETLISALGRVAGLDVAARCVDAGSEVVFQQPGNEARSALPCLARAAPDPEGRAVIGSLLTRGYFSPSSLPAARRRITSFKRLVFVSSRFADSIHAIYGRRRAGVSDSK